MAKGRSNLNLLKATMLLSTFPFLMATSPLPPREPSKTRYDDISFEATYVGINKQDTRYKEYEIDVQNIGEECVFYSLYQEYGTNPYLNLEIKRSEYVFYNEMLKPSEHMLVKAISAGEISDWSAYHFYAEKLSILDENVTFNNLSLDKPRYLATGNCIYELKGEISNENNQYYYGYILDVSYLGKEYSLYINPEYGITTANELDLNQLTIKSAKAYRSSYERANETSLNVTYHLLQYGIYYVLAIFIGVPVVIFSIIMIIKAFKKKKF